MKKRQIIKIDEAKCNGCGACVPGCKEGALKIIDGKARLVSEVYCDGLGACLGECPTGALTIETRTAEDFDETAVETYLATSSAPAKKPDLPCGCPGTMVRTLDQRENTDAPTQKQQQSELRQWPVQLALIPPHAPYLKNADLVLLADCTAVAYANLHADFIKGKIIAMACPKLDDTESYVEKLAAMIAQNGFRSIDVVMMEVPCCAGLAHVVDEARQRAKSNVPITKTIIGLEGGLKMTNRA